VTTSSARPSTLPDGTGELVRTWPAAGEPWAVLVVVHGLGEHSGRYEPVAGPASAAGIEVLSFDLIGHGSTGGRRADIDDWSRFLDQVQVHVEEARKSGLPVVLYGHSLGGLIALEYTLSERPRPDLLVLSAPALKGGSVWQRTVAPVLGRLAPTLAIPNAITGEQLSRDPAVGDAYFGDPLVLTKATTRFGAGLFEAMDRTRAAIATLDVPTLVIHGGSDVLVQPDASLPLSGHPMVERRLYPKLRHECHNEPERSQVVGEVIEWIEGRLRGTAG
jgi:alpha-beta hydrolase superfamily lysophospholipase